MVVGSGQKIARVGSIAGSGRQGGLGLMMPVWSVARQVRYQLQLGRQHWGVGLKNLSETCCNIIGRYISNLPPIVQSFNSDSVPIMAENGSHFHLSRFLGTKKVVLSSI